MITEIIVLRKQKQKKVKRNIIKNKKNIYLYIVKKENKKLKKNRQ